MRNKRFTFKKIERIHRKNDFFNVLKNGKRIENESLKLYYISNNLKFSRLGIVINKNFGKAVERNKAKRGIRELFRTEKHNINSGYDLVFYIKPMFRELRFIEKKNIFTNCSTGQDW